MKKLQTAFYAFLLSLVFTATGHAVTYNLRIVDFSDQPIPEVLVTVTTRIMGSVGSTSVRTDANGQASVTNPNFGGSSCIVILVSYVLSKPGYQFSQETAGIPCGLGSQDVLIRGTDLPKLTSLSAAGYTPFFARDMIIASFGDGLATKTEEATLPLKTTLAGRSILIKDSTGTERAARLFYVSPTQINYLTPPELPLGLATVRLVDEGGALIKFGFLNIGEIAPTIFTADASGKGFPAAVITRASSGYQVYEPVAKFDSAQQKFVPVAIDLGSESDSVVLVLFGTGWRYFGLASQMEVIVGGVRCQVEYVGKQTTFEGLDQLNVRLPRTLIGKRDVTVDVSFPGFRANQVQLFFQ